MVLAEDLRQAVLQAALQGKLTKQFETDSDVDEMLERISREKNQLIRNGDIKKSKLIKFVFDNEILFEIPYYWRWTILDEITTILGDGLHGTPQFDSDGEYYFINGNNLANRRIVLKDDTKKVSKEEFEKYKKELNNNTMLISINGTLGNIAFYNNENVILGKSACYFNVFENINKDYLFYFFSSFYFQQYIRENATGTTIKNVSLEVMRSTHIPLPPIEEQQRIVDKINEIMPKIDEYEKIEKELETLKKEFPIDMKDALLQAAMQGKLTKQLESDSSVDELARKENINLLDEEDYPYFIPDNWKFAELGELTSIPIKRGKAPKYVDKSGILVFAQKCNQKVGKISLDDAKYLDENIKHKYEQDNYLQGNDIVINSTGGGTLGRIGYISEALLKQSLPIVPDSHITTIRTKDNVLSKYIYFFLKFNQSYLETMGVGSTNQTELRPDTIKELLVALPPIEEQQRIVERLEVLLPLCEDLKEV